MEVRHTYNVALVRFETQEIVLFFLILTRFATRQYPFYKEKWANLCISNKSNGLMVPLDQTTS